MSNLNIGPVRAFNIMKEVCGGFDKVGAIKVDFKNFKKELNLFIGEFDAEMFVKRLMRKKEFLPNFSCEYQTTDESVLKCIFWVDEEMKRNFYMFGDVVYLMLPTSGTSNDGIDFFYMHCVLALLYNMMFVPFTGIDNHNRNVTLGAAILDSEMAETYSWLLKVIEDAYGYAPPVIFTDQDPVMKKAIADVWPALRHRLSILNDFGLTDHEWLTYIYGLRESWIPAYYRKEEMSGLMRTSSRSESENHFFGKISNPKCTLVEFLSHFDTAIEAQRHEHRKNDHDIYTNPEPWSDFVIEKQAVQIYTRTIFFDIQLEIQHAIHRCTSVRFDHVGDFIKFFIKDLDQLCFAFFEVMIHEQDVGCTSRNAEGNAATIVEDDAAIIIEGDGPSSNYVDVFYTSRNNTDLDDEDMAE
ncbi:protein FAR1-RELATED SEQUENCE 5-like [Helianthus annuus]|uniref:protein FAR1-RELATED SEQUENCE 5-like n=1 Tax=Helianthus annuus TaxID=4232 RepID=UPI000B903CAE|nr:protein FAR1-RELATED SEQUENCE 5-like [Helianthus annuus]